MLLEYVCVPNYKPSLPFVVCSCCKITPLQYHAARKNDCLSSVNDCAFHTNRFVMHTESGSQFRATTLHEDSLFTRDYSEVGSTSPTRSCYLDTLWSHAGDGRWLIVSIINPTSARQIRIDRIRSNATNMTSRISSRSYDDASPHGSMLDPLSDTVRRPYEGQSRLGA